jgi:hypothetical protein
MNSLNVAPAYGRVYKSKQEVLADWASGKDFVIVDLAHKFCGCYFSVRDVDTLVDEGFNVLAVNFSHTEPCAGIRIFL